MKIHDAFLTSKLGRRFFFLFVSSALIPILLLALVSFIQVKDQLHDQGKRKLRQSTKSVGLTIFERISLLNSDLKHICDLTIRGDKGITASKKYISNKFKALTYHNSDNKKKFLYKSTQLNKDSINKETLAPESARTHITIQSNANNQAKVFMSRYIQKDHEKKGFLVGYINTDYLWKVVSSDILPPNTEISVLNPNGKLIISSLQDPETFLRQAPDNFRNDRNRFFQWSDGSAVYTAHYWPIFMESRFTSKPWIIILSKPRNKIISPIFDFQNNFILVFLLSILSVTLLSMFNIRRILVPLEKIKAGIERISHRDFSTKVNVESNDEFKDVAHTFNEMTAHLDEQFQTIKTMSNIDRMILSSLDQDEIIYTMLNGLTEILPCSAASVQMQYQNNLQNIISYFRISTFSTEKKISNLSWQLLKDNFNQATPILFDSQTTVPWFIPHDLVEHSAYCYVIPVYLRGELVSLITLIYTSKPSTAERDLTRARQLADQMTIALENSRLVQELDNLHWASVRALAKTVDAKSSWTAGHSERVCSLAIDTALTLNMDQKTIHNLRQGALLHDIGKVGISNAILDKPGKLTPEEFNTIHQHPRMGAKILEPIEEYSQILPIVLQHHENFDGSGYPDGLAGHDIVYEARILAVADVFDALSSDRPYRSGWPFEQVLQFIEDNSSTKFDPEIADAFIHTVTSKKSSLPK